MTLKTKMSLLLFLTSISIVSIGFSSWSITAESTAELNGNIQVDNVISSDKYVYLDKTKGDNNTGISCFKYQEYGYMNSDLSAVSSKGYIKAYFTLDLKMCQELFIGDYKSIQLDLTLKYTEDTATSLNLFKYSIDENGSQDINSSCSSDNQNITISCVDTKGSDNNIQFKSKVTFNNLLTYYENNKSTIEKIDFVVTYELFATTGNYFYNNIYKYLYKDMIELINFKLQVQVSAI